MNETQRKERIKKSNKTQYEKNKETIKACNTEYYHSGYKEIRKAKREQEKENRIILYAERLQTIESIINAVCNVTNTMKKHLMEVRTDKAQGRSRSLLVRLLMEFGLSRFECTQHTGFRYGTVVACSSRAVKYIENKDPLFLGYLEKAKELLNNFKNHVIYTVNEIQITDFEIEESEETKEDTISNELILNEKINNLKYNQLFYNHFKMRGLI